MQIREMVRLNYTFFCNVPIIIIGVKWNDDERMGWSFNFIAFNLAVFLLKAWKKLKDEQLVQYHL